MLRLTSPPILVACAAVACVPNPDSQQAAGDAGAARPSARSAPAPTGRARMPSLPGRTLGPLRAPVTGPTPAQAPLAIAAPDAGAAVAAPAPGTDPRLTGVYTDTFPGPVPGSDWNLTASVWHIQGGRLCVQNAHNHGAWLRRTLPVNARIEFDAVSSSKDGDIKAELWGDGKSTATGRSYTNATSYLAIFGGWKNSYHVLARINEHATDRPQIEISADGGDLRAHPVVPGQTYHFKIERNDGKTVRWYVNDIEILDYPDKSPLKGAGHDHFGFNDWEVPVCFDNLEITPLEGG